MNRRERRRLQRSKDFRKLHAELARFEATIDEEVAKTEEATQEHLQEAERKYQEALAKLESQRANDAKPGENWPPEPPSHAWAALVTYALSEDEALDAHRNLDNSYKVILGLTNFAGMTPIMCMSCELPYNMVATKPCNGDPSFSRDYVTDAINEQKKRNE